MHQMLPKGEEVRRAVMWVSSHLQDEPDRPVMPLVQEAIFRFDLSPLEGEQLINFFRQRARGE